MAITMLVIFLASCNKNEMASLAQNDVDKVTSNQENYGKLHLFFNDAELTNLSEAEMIEYIENLSSTEIMNLKNDYLVAEYLTDINLISTVLSERHTEPLSKVDLSNYVNKQDAKELYAKFYKEEALELRENCWYKEIVIKYICDPSCFLKYSPYPCNPFCYKSIWVKCN